MDGLFDAFELRGLVRMQGVDDGARGDDQAQGAVEGADEAHAVDVVGGLALVEAGGSAVPEHGARVHARDPEDQVVLRDVVGHGAAGEVGAGEVVEAGAVLGLGNS